MTLWTAFYFGGLVASAMYLLLELRSGLSFNAACLLKRSPLLMAWIGTLALLLWPATLAFAHAKVSDRSEQDEDDEDEDDEDDEDEHG